MKCATPTAHPDTETIWFSCDADGRLSLIRPGDAAPAPAADGDARVGERILFTPLELDADCSLLLPQTRIYDPAPGTWVEEAPLAFRGGDSNLHRYDAELPPARTPDGGHGWEGGMRANANAKTQSSPRSV
jgi:hypothetical protein